MTEINGLNLSLNRPSLMYTSKMLERDLATALSILDTEITLTKPALAPDDPTLLFLFDTMEGFNMVKDRKPVAPSERRFLEAAEGYCEFARNPNTYVTNDRHSSKTPVQVEPTSDSVGGGQDPDLPLRSDTGQDDLLSQDRQSCLERLVQYFSHQISQLIDEDAIKVVCQYMLNHSEGDTLCQLSMEACRVLSESGPALISRTYGSILGEHKVILAEVKAVLEDQCLIIQGQTQSLPEDSDDVYYSAVDDGEKMGIEDDPHVHCSIQRVVSLLSTFVAWSARTDSRTGSRASSCPDKTGGLSRLPTVQEEEVEEYVPVMSSIVTGLSPIEEGCMMFVRYASCSIWAETSCFIMLELVLKKVIPCSGPDDDAHGPEQRYGGVLKACGAS
ncbi:hypothetical protein TREMEDRAFT_64812 [Tremella mesenterica DSM 1558]|uniref:uncharacterized protein n=1 Tax=Tremella mesenterica (strain ATCC 24925 / CBS 8224 / DSM 1558 / NBRC 9311 / NRRL Y-6157 / RJB 2259-6 / UBC 559-6) TaxID=578456 RepID=UPI0003F49AB9|nr:uncharacterized protein TREMEDRAFT_64812 [Tremella mesenterica DSM 1558]EIW66953.1 hypothetical protein TREMEDRAFT_64812 [Tremella mesenterica DSM 1558]